MNEYLKVTMGFIYIYFFFFKRNEIENDQIWL